MASSEDLRRLSRSLGSISSRLHEQTRKLEDAVEGRFARDAGDPRVRLLNETLHVSSRADLELSRIGAELTRITEDWQNQLGRSPAINADEREELTNSISSLKQERTELDTLSKIARELNSTHEFNLVLERVMDRVIHFVNAERGFLVLINPQTKRQEFTIARNQLGQSIAKREFATISQTRVDNVICTGQPILTDDADPTESMLVYKIHSVMCAPLIVRDRCIGVVYVDSRSTTTVFEARHLELLSAFCNQAAIAIDNARLFDNLSKTMKQVREDKQYMDNIFGSIVNGVVTTDSNGMITKFNAAAGLILCLAPEQMIGKHYTEAFQSLPQVGLVPLLDEAHTQHEHGTLVNKMIECTIAGRPGTVSLNCYVSSLRDTQDTHIGMALVIDDQTPIKQSLAEARMLRRLFEQYVPPKVVEELIKNPRALNLGGETKEISVVFADIRSYTRLSESLPPNEVMDMINRYLKVMCDAIWEQEGTLTAFQGDALMAIFNAPLPQSDHALRAVRASWNMRMAVLQHQRAHPKEEHVAFGFGVNTGQATVGNIGAKGRLQNYTAIGDAINVASRLQSNAANNDIYLNSTTYEQIQNYVQVDRPFGLEVKNRTVSLTVYRLLGPK